MATVRPIYLAKSMKELNAMAAEVLENKKPNPNMLVKSASKVFAEAKKCLLDGDQEKAYILFMRFFNILQRVKSTPEYKKDKVYYTNMLGQSNCEYAIKMAEELCEKLKTRYDELEAIEISKKLNSIDMKTSSGSSDNKMSDNMKTSKEPLNKDSKMNGEVSDVVDTRLDPNSPDGWLSIRKLYELVKSRTLRILLLDVRSKELFDYSHINLNVDTINTGCVLPGSTAKNIEIKVTSSSSSSLEMWRRRRDYDVIVIVDDSSDEGTLDRLKGGLVSTRDALVKWDTETKLKRDPVFLLGGFKEWAYTFPSLVTNPKPPNTNETIYSNLFKASGEEYDDTVLESIDYDLDLTMLKTPSTDHDSSINSSSEIPGINSSPGFPAKNNISGFPNNTAFLPSSSIIPPVDRSKKPSSSSKAERGPAGISSDEKLGNQGNKMAAATVEDGMPGVYRRLKHAPPQPLPRSKNNFTNSNDEGEDGGVADGVQRLQNIPDNVDKKNDSSDSLDDFELRKQLKIEIEKLNNQKLLLEHDIAVATDKMSSPASSRSSEQVSRDAKSVELLMQQKRKEARELADLLREKRKQQQELDKILKEKDQSIKEQQLQQNIMAPKQLPQQQRRQQPPGLSQQQQQQLLLRKQQQQQQNNSKPNRTTYTTMLKGDESDSTRDTSVEDGDEFKTTLKRSHSSPNIAKLLSQNGVATTQPQQQQKLNQQQQFSHQQPQFSHQQPQPPLRHHMVIPTPTIDRTIKPVNTIRSSKLEAKVRNFHPTWGSNSPGLTGLRNLGNTCYMNSILQCLSNCSMFCQYFLFDYYLRDVNWDSPQVNKGEIAVEFAALTKCLWSGTYKSVSPIDFRSVISKLGLMFATNQHQDAQELLEYLMSGLNDDLNRIRKKPQLSEQNNDNLDDRLAGDNAWRAFRSVEDSIVVDLFRGQYKSQVMCLTCDRKSTVFEPFMSLTLQIPDDRGRVDLSDCLLQFLKAERMSGDCRWLCPKCKQKREADKQIVLWRLPQILVIHLKRFHYQGIWRNKINTHVGFPVNNLDLSRYLSGPRDCESNSQTVYNLFAICNHYGTLDGGHYTAYCKNSQLKTWFKFDDSDVSDISPASLQTSAAYILFYSKA